MKMAAKSQPKKGKPAPKKKTSKSVPKKAAAAKKSAPPKKAKPAAAKKSAAPKKAKPARVKTSTAKTIPLADFVNMTYLTENGVKEWLKQGRLTGLQADSGEWMIEAVNLEVPDVKRLMR
jgi:hypothetical protein